MLIRHATELGRTALVSTTACTTATSRGIATTGPPSILNKIVLEVLLLVAAYIELLLLLVRWRYLRAGSTRWLR